MQSEERRSDGRESSRRKPAESYLARYIGVGASPAREKQLNPETTTDLTLPSNGIEPIKFTVWYDYI